MGDAGTDNIARVKKAYKAWDACKGGDCSMWHALADDNIRLNPIGAEAAGLEFTRPGAGREQLTAYLDSLRDGWAMRYFEPEIFVADGDSVVMFGHTSWTYKATGKTATVAIAHLWRFENGLAVEFTEVFDGSAAAAAAQP
ncbi:ketosteroid isomerase-like protein [Ancylobacter sp. 3268]|uniref:nuclear transport factor 2 family protein n=1 Tax=Ancylobacter sp. 3268 TaxID=2817752 RepID=UPI002866F6F6|nr:nuclear transport factor 2 family protein [Ancylobacter sp. 3268]MDR6951444.1 ketosteroid isomerase-like protein [Ancylobacter sp. 3268]